MERVRKTFFDPLATSKEQIRRLLEKLPVGSVHPYSPEKILLCHTEDGITEIDLSSYSESYFFNAVDLGEMGEVLLRRMQGFSSHLDVFSDFQITQAPASTFRIPIVDNQITIFAVSELTPTYWDFCFADADCNTCCWVARQTFPGITHSGDILNGRDLLDYVKISKDSLTEKEIGVFISGYQSTQITRFQGTHPAMLIADHVDKILYIVPVPLDTATIGDATICCPLVMKKDGDSIIFSILSAATTDTGMMCSSNKLNSPCFPEAINRADFVIVPPTIEAPKEAKDEHSTEDITDLDPEILRSVLANKHAALTTKSVTVAASLALKDAQKIYFGTGLEFEVAGRGSQGQDSSDIVLPCIFGSQLSGPVLLATGSMPSNVPFSTSKALREYYSQLKSVTFIVNDKMTDNARNLASSYRINALFIVQVEPEEEAKTADEMLSVLNSVNINTVTALAGPQSLVVVQIRDKFYFYRGIANREHLNTSDLAFGADITNIIESVGPEAILDPRVKRLVNLDETNAVFLPKSGQFVEAQDLSKMFGDLTTEQVNDLTEDISAVVPQFQILLDQADLQNLSKALLASLSAKVSAATTVLRDEYIKFLTEEYNSEDQALVHKKSRLLGNLRKVTLDTQKTLGPAISAVANMISLRSTSKRTHDLKRLLRQNAIQGNVEAAKNMSFETMAGYLETHASEMGVMLMNIYDAPYQQLLGTLHTTNIDSSLCCDLDSRVLYLDGLDAGIIMEQSQMQHHGPLVHQLGPSQPTMAVPYLNQGAGQGSMLAWVCWDEFVNLESPFSVRWMEKCNDAHIAALRIIMRSTLSQAVVSRTFNFQPASPEIGQLLSSLLMTAMSKLAATRATPPAVAVTAEDTSTKLMRGLFGNLLTVAGSGVRPMSMVWQLFGENPLYDVPISVGDWAWYETVISLYPYTGWAADKLYLNLGNLLDKVIVRVVTKGEDTSKVSSSQTRMAEFIRFCKLRNIVLDHSRTIITIIERMLTLENMDIPAIATRLLDQIPRQLERQTRSYSRLIKYLEHLAKGGERREKDDLSAANIYTSRSAAFSELKDRVATACRSNSWALAKASCQALIYNHADIAAIWNVKPEQLLLQNASAYKGILDADFGDDIDEDTKKKNYDLTRLVFSDAETRRVPWQVGKEGQFGNKIEPLDEILVQEILTGQVVEAIAVIEDKTESLELDLNEQSLIVTEEQDSFDEFKSVVQAEFLTAIKRDLTSEDACEMLKIPVNTMQLFAKTLNPEFEFADLGQRFKMLILHLLQNRSNRIESRPVRRLLDLDTKLLTA